MRVASGHMCRPSVTQTGLTVLSTSRTMDPSESFHKILQRCKVGHSPDHPSLSIHLSCSILPWTSSSQRRASSSWPSLTSSPPSTPPSPPWRRSSRSWTSRKVISTWIWMVWMKTLRRDEGSGLLLLGKSPLSLLPAGLHSHWTGKVTVWGWDQIWLTSLW